MKGRNGSREDCVDRAHGKRCGPYSGITRLLTPVLRDHVIADHVIAFLVTRQNRKRCFFKEKEAWQMKETAMV